MTQDKSDSARPPKFGAFLSYCHADAKAARKLHRKLESYRLPRQIVERAKAGVGPAGRLGPIFRDREDLPAATDLTGAVKDAMASAQALIVLCSPDAAKSPWVAREIMLFRELHPDRPVLAAIISGDGANVFPAPLLKDGKEPLAADLQASGDGPKLGFLKIVAGLAGVPLDALVQRDSQRQLRRITIVTAASVAGVILMAGVTAFAIASRNEARVQRNEAEGLVEFMLTDLREKLRGVGRLDIMSTVNERAMTYYDRQGQRKDLTDESLERRSRVLHAMGEDDWNRGDKVRALAEFKAAHRATAAILARHPNDPQAIFAHAQSEYWVGYVPFVANEHEAARLGFTAYKQLADRLVSIDPQNVKWLQESVYAEGNLCAYSLQEPVDAAAALVHCKASLERIEAIRRKRPADPSVLSEIVNRHAWLATAWRANGDIEKALVEREEQLNNAQSLVELDSRNAGSRLVLMVAQLASAEELEKSGVPDSLSIARRHAVEARGNIVALKSLDPANKYLDVLEERLGKLEAKLRKDTIDVKS